MVKTATYYHCSLKPIGRSAGRSAVNCAAYRTGTRMEDVRYGVVRDFTEKKDVVTSFTLAPDDAPAWASDTGQLWNKVEAFERRKDSQLAFEWECALPNELSHDAREQVIRNFGGWLVDEYGVAVTIGIHEGGTRGNGLNDHAHCMMTTRPLDEEGFAAKKLSQFSSKPGKPNPEVYRVREQLASFINDALEEAGSDERVTHESYSARGIAIEGTKHLGPAASAYEQQGIATSRGDRNREIIEARLLWQQDIEPEIDHDVAADLAARFGDEILPSELPPPDAMEAQKGIPNGSREARPGEGSSQHDWHIAWERAALTVRGYWQRLVEFARDESSGHRMAQTQSQETAEQEEDSGEPQSWVERMSGSKPMQAGLEFLHNSRPLAATETSTALKDDAPAARLEATLKAPAPQNAFERLAATVSASTARSFAKTPNIFDRVTQARAAPKPDTPTPEPDNQTPEL